MWVNAREREKNKEKHVNGAMFLTWRNMEEGVEISLMCSETNILRCNPNSVLLCMPLGGKCVRE
jgi:hypothetical protein